MHAYANTQFVECICVTKGVTTSLFIFLCDKVGDRRFVVELAKWLLL